MDKHYWKEAYQHLWAEASKKEEAVQSLIKSELNVDVVIVGMGAGSSDFIKGSASDNNMIKGDADLYIPALDAYLEVTGPNIPVAFDASLWFRPDKFQNSESKLKSGVGKYHFVIHLIDDKIEKIKKIRVINLDSTFFKRLHSNEFRLVYPTIRGRQETYYDIPSSSSSIMSFGEFIELLKSQLY